MDWKLKYRPETLYDMALPDSIRKKFLAFQKEEYTQNLLLVGSYGKGKTTVAKLLRSPENTLFISSSDCSGVESINNSLGGCTSMTLNGGRRLVIIDEAERLSNQAFHSLRGSIEKLSVINDFVFTCNDINKIDQAILSRLEIIDFNFNSQQYPNLKIQLLNRIKHILLSENIVLNQELEQNIKYLVKNFEGDYRKLIGKLQSLCFEMN
jgi:replication factor C small subunit